MDSLDSLHGLWVPIRIPGSPETSVGRLQVLPNLANPVNPILDLCQQNYLAHPRINTPKDVFLQCQEGAHTMDITQHFSTGVRSHIVCVYSVTSPGHTTIHMHLADILGLLPNCWGPLSLRFRGSMHFGKYRKTVPSFNSPTEQVYLIHQVLAFPQSHAEKPWFSSKLRKERKP